MPVQVLCPNPRCGVALSGTSAELAGLDRCPRCGQPLGVSPPPYGSPPSMMPALAPGSSFGRYRIDRALGHGGMGSVYLAHDSQLDRPVALKVPHIPPGSGPEVLARFYREARAAAALDHPNLCPVYDVGEADGTPYLTMAYIDGRPLSHLIGRDQPLPQRQVAAVIRKLALALQEAHDRGIVHRDLKPANILVSRKKDLVIVDFGLARRDDGDARLTQSGMILGTPAYMAPEQVAGELDRVGPASDIYSLGVILYEMLTARVPFEGSAALVLGRILAAEPEPVSSLRPDVEPRLATICQKAMAKEPGARYGTMGELAAALSEYLRGEAEPGLPDGAMPPPIPIAGPPAAPSTMAGSETLLGRFVDRFGSREAQGPPLPIRLGGPPEPGAAGGRPRRPFSRRLALVAAGAAVLLTLLGVVIYVVTVSGGPHRPADPAPPTLASDEQPARTGDLAAQRPAHEARPQPPPDDTSAPPAATPGGPSGGVAASTRVADEVKPSGTKAADIWEDWRGGRQPPGLTIAHPTVVSAIAFSPDGRTIASALPWEKAVQIADAKTGNPIREIKTGHKNQVWSLSFSPSGEQIATGTFDIRGTVEGVYKIWDAATGEAIRTVGSVVNLTGGASYTADGRYLLGAGQDGQVVVFDAETGRERRVLRLEDGKVKGDWVRLPTGRMIAFTSVAEPGTIKTIDLDDGREVGNLRGEPGFKIGQDFRDASRILLVNGTVQSIRDGMTGREIVRFDPVPGNLNRRGLTPDGRWLIGGTRDGGFIHIWDASTGREVASFKAHDELSWGFAISRDGRRFASGSFDKTTKVWDLPARPAEAGDRSSGIAPSGAAARVDDFRPLFNGKDLTGWSIESGKGNTFRIEDGDLVVTGTGDYRNMGWLLSDRIYGDFALRFEFRPEVQANSGVAFRTLNLPAREWPARPEIQVSGRDHGQTTGGLFWRKLDGQGFLSPYRAPEPGPADSWDRMEIELRGPSLRVAVNDREVFTTDLDQLAGQLDVLPGLARRSGRIGFQAHTGTVRFRNVRIKSLDGASSQPADRSPEIITTEVAAIKLKRIPAGTFLMGSPEGEGNPDEHPQHEVRITQPFYLGVYEVTQGQYQAVIGNNPSFFKGSDDLPVEQVSWLDVVRFCNKLSEREGRKPYYRIERGRVTIAGGDGYRLPTEAEWEYACRAGTTSPFSFGDDEEAQYAWYLANADRRTHPVGTKRANAFGLHDMHGNVWEWCWDVYDAGYYKHSPATDPGGARQAVLRVLRVVRGCCWGCGPRACWSALRHRAWPDHGGSDLGFRMARGQSSR